MSAAQPRCRSRVTHLCGIAAALAIVRHHVVSCNANTRVLQLLQIGGILPLGHKPVQHTMQVMASGVQPPISSGPCSAGAVTVPYQVVLNFVPYCTPVLYCTHFKTLAGPGWSQQNCTIGTTPYLTTLCRTLSYYTPCTVIAVLNSRHVQGPS